MYNNNEIITRANALKEQSEERKMYNPYLSAPAFVPESAKKPPRIKSAEHEMNILGWLVLIQTALSVAVTFSFMLVYALAGMNVSRLSSDAMYWLMCVSSVLSTFLPALIYVWCSKGTRISQLLDFINIKAGVFILSVLAGLSICLLANIPSTILTEFLEMFGYSSSQEAVETTFSSASWLQVLAISFLAPVFEEFVFRGIILKKLERFGTGFAVFASALLFGLAHIDLPSVVFAFICGLVFGFLYTKTRNLWVPIVIHFLNNSLSLFMGYSSELFGENADFINNTLFIAFIAIGVISLIALLVFKRELFRNPVPRKERVSSDGSPSLSTGESLSVIRHAPSFWVSVGLSVVSVIFSIVMVNW